jgi:hypothetical protein
MTATLIVTSFFILTSNFVCYRIARIDGKECAKRGSSSRLANKVNTLKIPRAAIASIRGSAKPKCTENVRDVHAAVHAGDGILESPHPFRRFTTAGTNCFSAQPRFSARELSRIRAIIRKEVTKIQGLA